MKARAPKTSFPLARENALVPIRPDYELAILKYGISYTESHTCSLRSRDVGRRNRRASQPANQLETIVYMDKNWSFIFPVSDVFTCCTFNNDALLFGVKSEFILKNTYACMHDRFRFSHWDKPIA